VLLRQSNLRPADAAAETEKPERPVVLSLRDRHPATVLIPLDPGKILLLGIPGKDFRQHHLAAAFPGKMQIYGTIVQTDLPDPGEIHFLGMLPPGYGKAPPQA